MRRYGNIARLNNWLCYHRTHFRKNIPYTIQVLCMRQSRSRQSRNELTHPSAPISGNTLMNLKLVLESVVGDGEIRDLDLAMLLNVPVNRLGRLKKAGAPAGAAERPEPDDEQDDAAAATIRPNQAILVRLLLKHPEYAPLTMRPGNAEMFELISPLMSGTGSNGKMAGKQGYAPLFEIGRASCRERWELWVADVTLE